MALTKDASVEERIVESFDQTCFVLKATAQKTAREFVLRSEDNDDRQRWIVILTLSMFDIDGPGYAGVPIPSWASGTALTSVVATSASAAKDTKDGKEEDPKVLAAEAQWHDSHRYWDGVEKAGAVAAKEKGLVISKEKEADYIKCFLLLVQAADSGNGEACNRLGRCFREGVGTKVDLKNAIRYFEAAVKNGCVQKGSYNLGFIFERDLLPSVTSAGTTNPDAALAAAKTHYRNSAAVPAIDALTPVFEPNIRGMVASYRLESEYYIKLNKDKTTDPFPLMVLSHVHAFGVKHSTLR